MNSLLRPGLCSQATLVSGSVYFCLTCYLPSLSLGGFIDLEPSIIHHHPSVPRRWSWNALWKRWGRGWFVVVDFPKKTKTSDVEWVFFSDRYFMLLYSYHSLFKPKNLRLHLVGVLNSRSLEFGWDNMVSFASKQRKKDPFDRGAPGYHRVTFGELNYMGVSKNRDTAKSSILIGFSIINHPFGGTTIFGNTHIFGETLQNLFNTDSKNIHLWKRYIWEMLARSYMVTKWFTSLRFGVGWKFSWYWFPHADSCHMDASLMTTDGLPLMSDPVWWGIARKLTWKTIDGDMARSC